MISQHRMTLHLIVYYVFLKLWYMLSFGKNIIKTVRQDKKDLLDKSKVVKNRVAIVLNANNGLGIEILKRLLEFDYLVIAAVDDVNEMSTKIKKIQGKVEVMEIDITLIKSIKKFSKRVTEKYPDIHLIVNNGDATPDPEYFLTDDGYEYQWIVNYAGCFYLTHMLCNTLKSSAEKCGHHSRIVNVTSSAHEAGYISFQNTNMYGEYDHIIAHTRSKLAQIMSSIYINKIFERRNFPIRSYSVNRGIMASDLSNCRSMPWLLKNMKTQGEALASIIYCCLSADLENKGGSYIDDCRVAEPSNYSKNEHEQMKLFVSTCQKMNIINFGNMP